MTRQAVTAAILALVAGTASGAEPVAARKAHWEAVVRAELPVGTTLGELRRWAEHRGLPPPDPSRQTYQVALENVPVTTFGCNSFVIELDVALADQTISKEAVRTLGVCL